MAPRCAVDESGRVRSAAAVVDALLDTGPILPRVIVRRPRVWAALDRSTSNAATMLVAPTGSGKTVAVASWLEASEPKALWVNARSDLMPAQLDTLLAKAREPDMAQTPASPALLVLDDSHALPPASVAHLDELIHQHPESLRIVLITRWDLPFNRLVPELTGHFATLRGDLLRLDPEEAAELVSHHGRTRNAQVVSTVVSRADGWCAPAVLLARAIAGARDPLDALSHYEERGPALVSMIATEAFDSLSDRERHVLMCVVGEDLVSPKVAAHLSQDAHAHQILEDLSGTGVLVVHVRDPESHVQATAGSDHCYRVHPLLRATARHSLTEATDQAERARRSVELAVKTDLQRGESSQAFTRLVSVGLVDSAASVLGPAGLQTIDVGLGDEIRSFARAHPAAFDLQPSAALTVLFDAWLHGDMATVRHWSERIFTDSRVPASSADRACAQLAQALLGEGAVEEANRLGEEVLADDSKSMTASYPVLLLLLGMTNNWLGHLAAAERHLSDLVIWCNNTRLPTLAGLAKSHLASTEYLRGLEQVSLTVAKEVLTDVGAGLPYFESSHDRAHLIVELCLDQIDPWPMRPHDQKSSAAPRRGYHDPLTRHLARISLSRHTLIEGSLPESRRLFVAPLDIPELPPHLALGQAFEVGGLAYMAGDRPELMESRDQLLRLGAEAEAEVLNGWACELTGDTAGAAECYQRGSRSKMQQPAVRAMALVCEAQILDARGQESAAFTSLQEAISITQVRRTAQPFLGISRLGTPIVGLLERFAMLAPSEWLLDLLTRSGDHPGLAPVYGPLTATIHETAHALPLAALPALTTRERQVLHQLARGASYRDAAANLSVSENTVKTHVSSIYAKLGATRRSEALAIARTHGLM